MKNIQLATPSRNRVTALFRADLACFELPAAATLGELADRVHHLGARNRGALVGVNVILAAQPSMSSRTGAGMRTGGVR